MDHFLSDMDLPHFDPYQTNHTLVLFWYCSTGQPYYLKFNNTSFSIEDAAVDIPSFSQGFQSI